MKAFKYFTEETHAIKLIEKGELLFRPLSYYRELEDGEVRGDIKDGQLIYSPSEGLDLTKIDGTKLLLNSASFTSSINTDQIFIYSVTEIFSADLAKKFGQFCVEIPMVETIVKRLQSRANPKSIIDYENIHYGEVSYRSVQDQPIIDWAFPEKIAFIKPESFGWQSEIRIVIGRRGAFNIENVLCKIQDDRVLNSKSNYSMPIASGIPLIVGKIEGLKLHYF